MERPKKGRLWFWPLFGSFMRDNDDVANLLKMQNQAFDLAAMQWAMGLPAQRGERGEWSQMGLHLGKYLHQGFSLQFVFEKKMELHMGTSLHQGFSSQFFLKRRDGIALSIKFLIKIRCRLNFIWIIIAEATASSSEVLISFQMVNVQLLCTFFHQWFSLSS